MACDLTFILKGYELTNTQRVIYGVLEGLSKASAKRGRAYAYIGQKAIAERVGVCPRTVYAALKRLQEVGLIMVKRRGLTRTNAIYVLSPSSTREERKVTKLICESGTAKNAIHIGNSQRDIKHNTIDKSINPVENAPTAQTKDRTAPKGKPTNKQKRRTVEERRVIKKHYKEYLINRLEFKKFKEDILSHGDDIEALEKVIELISNTMASKGKIMVNGALLIPAQWWYVAKSITLDGILTLIRKIANTPNIRNYRAYMLASIYNQAMENTLQMPAYL